MNKIIHLGLGNFHKAHQAWYFDKLTPLEKWEITAFSMQRADAARELRAQNFEYEVIALANQQEERSTIRSITKSGFIQEDEPLLLQLARDPQMTLITLTVTEKGYDLQGPALEALAKILKVRTTPLTILSCDNLQSNGEKLESLVRQKMGKHYPENLVSFPNSMVDRIVPASEKGAPIKTEIFSQWVIEDKFKSKRPCLEKVGVQFVSDVAPWELMKLRLLNAAHSFLAYYGLNRGFEYVHQAISDDDIRSKLIKLWQEIIPHLPSELHAQDYIEKLLIRFNNPNLPHRLSQIATDGSVKLPQRIMPSLKSARAKGAPCEMLESVIEEWTEAMTELAADLFSDPLREMKDKDMLKEELMKKY